ncbi:MAG: hypothetical protein MUF42_07535 [Cytophagaceae bacterium]|nr:hypothetical protein [Cytophagaceae bacterium]
MKSIFGYLLAGIVFMTSQFAVAQTGGLVQSAEIIKDASTELGEANRSYEKISDFPPAQPEPTLTYEPGEVILALPKLDSKTKVVPLKTETTAAPGRGYIKLGAGNYASTYLDAFLSNKKADKAHYYIRANHLAYGNGAVRYARMSENGFSAGIGTSVKWLEVSGIADYATMRHNYYGFDNSLSGINEDSLKFRFHKFKTGVIVKSKPAINKVSFTTGLTYYHTGNSTLSESEWLAPLAARYTLDSNSWIGIDGSYDFIRQQDTISRNRILWSVEPSYTKQINKLKFKAGVAIQYSNDTLNDVKGVRLFPHLYGEYTFIPETMVFYSEFSGGYLKNNVRNGLEATPFLFQQSLLANSIRKFEWTLGFKSRVKNKAHLHGQFVAGKEGNFMVLTNGLDSSTFLPVYDPGKIQYLGFQAGVSVQVTKVFRSGIQWTYRHYRLDTLSFAWHRPGTQLEWKSKLNLKQKIYFTADFYYLSNLRGYNLSEHTSVKLKNIADLNLGVEYRFSDAFGAFVSANNILAQKYQRYLHYPVNGFNLMAGLSYRF